jgi:hypothetical protein
LRLVHGADGGVWHGGFLFLPQININSTPLGYPMIISYLALRSLSLLGFLSFCHDEDVCIEDRSQEGWWGVPLFCRTSVEERHVPAFYTNKRRDSRVPYFSLKVNEICLDARFILACSSHPLLRHHSSHLLQAPGKRGT